VDDTEVSPAPSKEGYYLTFVEMRRNSEFPQRLMQLLAEVSRLTNVQTWQFTSVDLKPGEVLDLNPQNLTKHVNLKPKNTDPKEQIREWFSHSSLSDVLVEQHQITLHRGHVNWCLNVKQFDEQMPAQALSYDQNANSTALRLERLLEGGYQVHALSQGLLIEHPQDSRFLWVAVPHT
jgi:hypothetical protein